MTPKRIKNEPKAELKDIGSDKKTIEVTIVDMGFK